jgi:tRNA A-37 threonylcarbamoyl transferase component Bud32/CheY-like chemotaxis protein
MPDMDAIALADHAVMIGLVSRGQAREAVSDAEDGTIEALSRSFLRKGLLTSWQIDKLQKGDPTGFFFGRCKVLFHLAEGTFARVYRGEREETRKPVAIKVLRNRFVADPAAVERFNKEAEAGMKLRHPNIVQIITYGEEDKKHYMIMEYVEGANLRDFLRIRGRLSEKDALPLMIGLAQGLKYSMDQGVTHRDIKGTNILVSNTGEAKLVDFGLAAIEGEKKSTMQSQRTVDYSALERTCGSHKGDPRSDIYFLGCVYYQMLTGKLPMMEVESKDPLVKMLKRSFGAIQPLRDSPHAPGPKLCGVVEKMMSVDLKARYQTMDQVLEELEACQSGGPAKAEEGEGVAVGEHDFLANLDDLFVSRHKVYDAGVSPPPGAPRDGKPALAAEEGDVPAHAPHAGDKHSAPRRHVLCVETQSEVQDAFRKTLSKMGYRVILVGDAERAAERYREAPPDAVVFDLDGLGSEALDSFIDMHDKAHEDGHDLAALVLLGPRHLGLQEKLPTDDRLIVLAKPVKMKQIQDALVKLVPIRSGPR